MVNNEEWLLDEIQRKVNVNKYVWWQTLRYLQSVTCPVWDWSDYMVWLTTSAILNQGSCCFNYQPLTNYLIPVLSRSHWTAMFTYVLTLGLYKGNKTWHFDIIRKPFLGNCLDVWKVALVKHSNRKVVTICHFGSNNINILLKNTVWLLWMICNNATSNIVKWKH